MIKTAMHIPNLLLYAITICMPAAVVMAQESVGSSLVRPGGNDAAADTAQREPDNTTPSTVPEEPAAPGEAANQAPKESTTPSAPSPEPFLTGPGNWVPVSGPHLDQGTYQVLRGMLIHPGAGLEVRALDTLENSVRQGLTGPDDPNVIELVEWASLSALDTRGISLAPSASQQPAVRAQSARLLGLIGGDEALGVLMRVLREEYDPVVLAEAYASIRKINPRPTNELATLIALHLRDRFANPPHNSLIAEILQTIDTLNRGYGALATRDVFDAIFAVQQDSRYLLAVRNKALILLKRLMGLQ